MGEIGALIRHWRGARRMSQAELAEAAEVSARHLSWLETGRSRPSREMVLVLGSALDVPLRERNALLLAAGFAPAYRTTTLDDPTMAPLKKAMEHLLRAAEPYGALAMTHRWELIRANRPWERMAQMLLGRPLVVGENMMTLVFTELAPFLADREATLGVLLDRLGREAAADDDLVDLYDALAKIARPRAPLSPSTAPPALTVDLRVGDLRLSLFTTLTTLGTPMDVCASELRIEHYFPADLVTEGFLRGL